MIFAIADTHLDGNREKPMGIFSQAWENHPERIAYFWRQLVRDDDVVLMPGDISWALKLEEAVDDLRFLDGLPGRKLISRGNHDYWWSSLKKMRELHLQTIEFVQNDAHSIGRYEVVGCRSWMDPNNKDFAVEDEKIFAREKIRLELSLAAAKPGRPIIAMLHYPPFTPERQPNAMHDILRTWGVEVCLYGHLHGAGHRQAVEGVVDGIEYRLCSCDYIHFQPILIRRSL